MDTSSSEDQVDLGPLAGTAAYGHAMSCLCHHPFKGWWFTNQAGKNQPAWFCVWCGAFDRVMSPVEAKHFIVVYRKTTPSARRGLRHIRKS